MKYRLISRSLPNHYGRLEIGKIYEFKGGFESMYITPFSNNFKSEWAVWQPVNFIDYYEAIQKR